jgi:hypothetical protein
MTTPTSNDDQWETVGTFEATVPEPHVHLVESVERRLIVEFLRFTAADFDDRRGERYEGLLYKSRAGAYADLLRNYAKYIERGDHIAEAVSRG